jgi:hypothetical protein
MSNSKQTIHSQAKPPSSKHKQKYKGKTKNGLDKGRNKRSSMVRISQTTTRRCMKYGDNEIQNADHT